MSNRLRWGIMGTGNIARQFAAGVRASRRGELAGVGSRDQEKADAFAGEHGVHRAVGSYEALLRLEEVDAIYVSLPNSLHHQWTLKSLEAGKHVLCEKPFAVTLTEAVEMFDAARAAGRVVMEAFMYRSHPQTLAALEAARSGAIGDVTLIRTSFCFRTRRVEGNVRFQPDLAGGALMDVGCYCLSFARLFAGSEPTEARATGRIHPSGVDDLASGILRFAGGPGAADLIATFTCGLGVEADNTAQICGTEGYIEIATPWKPPTGGAGHTIAHSAPPRMDSTGHRNPPAGPPPRTFHAAPTAGNLYAMEADDFAAAILETHPLPVTEADTLGNTSLLQQLRQQIGLGY